jgi:hypothetical protein
MGPTAVPLDLRDLAQIWHSTLENETAATFAAGLTR